MVEPLPTRRMIDIRKESKRLTLKDAIVPFAWFLGIPAVLFGLIAAIERANEDGVFFHDKLSIVTARDWAVGEYKSCSQSNLQQTEDEPQLDCAGAQELGNAKKFKVRFYGVNYQPELKDKADFLWRCKKNESSDPAFTCDDRKAVMWDQKQSH